MTTEDDLNGRMMNVLNDVFGFSSFLSDQEEIVRAIVARQDAFVVMPTGGGKSLCYQLPAHVMSGTCVVISPLISLMKDQVDAAVETGLRASFLNSSLLVGMKRQVQTQLAAGELDLIYVSPERFAMPEFLDTLRNIDLSFIAIDEAHCISEWGHDFRPDYLNLSSIVKELPDIPVAAFTATATHKVQDDIVAKLKLRSPHVVRASFNRPNLFYKVIQKQKPGDQILRFVRARVGEPGIIYRTTRKSVEQTADMLVRNGIKALPYHAGLSDAIRAQNQDSFNKDEVDVVVATIAFGMGIDKSNVRYVLHGDLPKNMESYYQETGRSGRDGEPAHCQLLFGYGDVPKIRYFIDQITDDAERARSIRCLNDMVRYATIHACRRKQLLNYFGEEYPPVRDEGGDPKPEADSSLPCCDICAGEVDSVDATRDAQIVLSAIVRTQERFGITHIIAVVIGEDSDRMRQLGHDQIKTFGIGKDKDKRHWRLIIENLFAQGFILQTQGDYPIIQLLPESREVLFEGRQVQMLKTKKVTSQRRRRGRNAGVFATGRSSEGYDEDLFEMLRTLRKDLATEQGVPPYVVFNDRTLHEMARFLPVTESEMLDITGVGEKRFASYGKQFVDAITKFKQPTPTQ